MDNGRIPLLRLIFNAFVAAGFSLFMIWFLLSVVGQWIPSIRDILLKPVSDAFDNSYTDCIAANPSNIIGCIVGAAIVSLIFGGFYLFILYIIFAGVVAGILTFITVKTNRVINTLITVLFSLPIAVLVIVVVSTIAKAL